MTMIHPAAFGVADAFDVQLHRFSHRAMATLFEIICVHPDAEYARQAAWAAFDLVDRMEQELSRFIENSDISRINHLAPEQSLRVSRWTMDCLVLSHLAYEETGGAFDISLGSGLLSLELIPDTLTVRSCGNTPRLDLGGIGKGYALDRMAESLIDWDVHQALLHGGYSSVLALDAPSRSRGWPLSMSVPGDAERRVFAVVHAGQMAISASGLQKGPHIMNRPSSSGPLRTAAWALGSSRALARFGDQAQSLARGTESLAPSPAAVAEIFSTAFIILPVTEAEHCCNRWPGLEAWLIDGAAPGPDGLRPIRHLQKGTCNYET